MGNKKHFVGAKLTKAEPMTRGECYAHLGRTLSETDNPEDAGYLVEYADGYESFSPAPVFEKYYIEVDNGVKVHDDDVHNLIENLGVDPDDVDFDELKYILEVSLDWGRRGYKEALKAK